MFLECKLKKSFIVYHDQIETFEAMDDETRGKMLLAMFKYEAGEEVVFEGLLAVVWASIKSILDRDRIKYHKTVERNRQNGKKGGRPKAAEPQKTQSVNSNPKKADSDSDSDSDSESERDINKKGKKRFSPPSIEEVSIYVEEKGFTFSADNFVNHYASKGWMIGKNKMKDWKAACRTWGSRDRDQKPKSEPTIAELLAARGEK